MMMMMWMPTLREVSLHVCCKKLLGTVSPNLLFFQVHGSGAQQRVVRLPQQDLRHQPEDDAGGADVRRSPEKRVAGSKPLFISTGPSDTFSCTYIGKHE
jgi:hypothetical protein